MKLFKTAATISVLALMTGCASVKMAPESRTAEAKAFETPETGEAGIYVFRSNSILGASLKKDIWIDGECIGESARGVFFYHPVEGDEEHKIATESEFSPNTLDLYTESGKNYFVEQYLKPGVFVGGANLRQLEENQGMNEIQELDMAEKGTCS